MIDILREIILDFQELDWPMGIPRRVHVAPMPGKATVCIGVRRSGKSTFMLPDHAATEASKTNFMPDLR